MNETPMKKEIMTYCFLVLTLANSPSYGQVTQCYRFIDTLYIHARVINIEPLNCCECGSICYIINNDQQKEKAITEVCSFYNTSLENRKPIMGDSILLLHSYIGARQFALMKAFLEDSLSSRFTDQRIGNSIADGFHPDSLIDKYTDFLPVPVSEKSLGKFQFMGPDRSYGIDGIHLISPSSPSKIDTIQNGYWHFAIKDFAFKSWGIIAEVKRECRYFMSETGETLLFDSGYEKIRVFIPMSLKEQ